MQAAGHLVEVAVQRVLPILVLFQVERLHVVPPEAGSPLQTFEAVIRENEVLRCTGASDLTVGDRTEESGTKVWGKVLLSGDVDGGCQRHDPTRKSPSHMPASPRATPQARTPTQAHACLEGIEGGAECSL